MPAAPFGGPKLADNSEAVHGWGPDATVVDGVDPLGAVDDDVGLACRDEDVDGREVEEPEDEWCDEEQPARANTTAPRRRKRNYLTSIS